MEGPSSLGSSSSFSPTSALSAPQSLTPGSSRSIHDLQIGPGQACVCDHVCVCMRVFAHAYLLRTHVPEQCLEPRQVPKRARQRWARSDA